jgi:hypothetical protein
MFREAAVFIDFYFKCYFTPSRAPCFIFLILRNFRMCKYPYLSIPL